MFNKNNKQLIFKFYSTKGSFCPTFSTTQLYTFEHISEIKQRIFYVLIFLSLTTITIFSRIKIVVQLLESSVTKIQFFQASPDEYFLSTFIISISAGFILCIPFALGQSIFFFRPALSLYERKIINLLLGSSLFLFFLGLAFSYFVLIPAALNFFIFYSSEVLEPFLSFEEYYKFITSLFISTGLVFQLPIIQVILSLIKLINPKEILNFWRPFLLISTILGAILTPSADPLTQLLLSLALFLLYLLGTITSIYLVSKV